MIWLAMPGQAAEYAAHVIDARTGEVLHSHNADTRLHPASLTKMMTLYVTFEAIRNGELGLDDDITISRHAANEPPSKLGLQAGSKIKLRYLIRAAAVKSANDAATALGEAVSGSEAAFAERMTRTAKAMGMNKTTFKNAHGLTSEGHLSTAHDMTILGRQLFYDYPEYYNLFSRQSTNAGLRTVNNTNRAMLSSYKGADGIKTGYTRAAGFNLVASAQRGEERIIATVFGGRSTASRNAKIAELLDLGFSKAPSQVRAIPPSPPAYTGMTKMVKTDELIGTRVAGKTIRLQTAVATSLRPVPRPGTGQASPAAPALVAQVEPVVPATVADTAIESAVAEAVQTAVQTAAIVPDVAPVARPADLLDQFPEALAPSEATNAAIAGAAEARVVTRVSTSGGRHWGINVGRYNSQYQAERILLTTAMNEIETLDGSLRRVVRQSTGFDANFMGLTREDADLACRRLQARNQACFMIGPDV